MENNQNKTGNIGTQGTQRTQGTQVSQSAQANSRNQASQSNLKAKKIVYYFLGVLEVLFAFRLFFKILGANPQSTFVSIIYSITGLFIAPFVGIFRIATTQGIETEAVLEPTLVIAMVVYAAIAWGIVKLIEISGKQKDTQA